MSVGEVPVFGHRAPKLTVWEYLNVISPALDTTVGAAA